MIRVTKSPLGPRGRSATAFALAPIRWHEIPMWLLVIAFVYISSSDFKPQWIAQELDPTTFAPVVEPVVTPLHLVLKLSRFVPSFRTPSICHGSSANGRTPGTPRPMPIPGDTC